MAVQRLSATNIKVELLRITGYDTSAFAPWLSDANLYRIVNLYGQRLASQVAVAARDAGLPITGGNLKLDMWRSTASLTTSAGSSTVYFPTDYDQWISFFDTTNTRPVNPIEEVDRWYTKELREKPAGPPEAIEILGYVTNAGNWVRQATLYPDTVAGITPAITLTYWRLPAIMAGTDPDNEYPDADYKYHALWVYGPALELLRPSDPAYSRYAELERGLLVDLAHNARSV